MEDARIGRERKKQALVSWMDDLDASGLLGAQNGFELFL
jgi:hypothetical protein